MANTEVLMASPNAPLGGILGWLQANLDFPPSKTILVAFLTIQFVTLSTGYPLIFHGLGRIADRKASRHLCERFQSSGIIRSLKWIALFGTIYTGIVILFSDDGEGSRLWGPAAWGTALCFFLTVILFFLTITKVIKFAFRPWEEATSIQFRYGQDLTGLRRLISRAWGVKKHLGIRLEVNRWRKDLGLVGEQIRCLAPVPGYDEELDDLRKVLFSGLTRALLCALERKEWRGEEGGAEKGEASESAVLSLAKQAMDEMSLAYGEAEDSGNQAAQRAIRFLLEALVVEHSRILEGDELVLRVSDQLTGSLLNVCLEIMGRTLRRDGPRDLTLAICLYNDVVFLEFERELGFPLLGRFDRYLMNVGRRVAESGKSTLYESFMGYLNDGPRFHPGLATTPWELATGPLPGDADGEDLSKLTRDQTALFSPPELERFESEWSRLLPPDMPEVDRVEAEVIDSAKGWLKLNHLRECLFDIGAWCLAESRPDFIRAMWECHQPPDSTATYGENTLLPPDALSTLKHYLFVRRPRERDHDFAWSGHHGKGGWFSQYVILHLLATHEGRLQRISWAQELSDEEAANEILDHLTPTRVESVRQDVEQLVSVARWLSKDEQTPRLLRDLGFSVKDEEEPISRTIIPLLEKIVEVATRAIDTGRETLPIDNNLVQAFSERVGAGFLDRFPLAYIAQQHGKKSDVPNTVTITHPQRCLHWLLREILIADWHIDGSSLGSDYGGDLAHEIQSWMLHRMVRAATRISFEAFKETCHSAGPDLVLISAPMALGFRSVWREEFELDEGTGSPSEPLRRAYRGRFDVGNRRITAYSLNTPPAFLPFPPDSALIVEGSMLGRVTGIAESPNENGEVNWDFDLRIGEPDMSAWFRVRELPQSEIDELLNGAPPDWLTQCAHDAGVSPEHWLKTHLVLSLGTKLGWSFSRQARGYLVTP